MTTTDATAETERRTGWRGRLRGGWERLERWWKAHQLQISLVFFGFLLAVAYFWESIFISIYPGQAGVLWRRFTGTVTGRVYDEGFHVIFPWDRMYIYNVRLQETSTFYDVLSADGLDIEVELSIRFRPIKESLPSLHKHLGPDYIQSFILPEIGAQAREEIAQYEPDELYTESRRLITEAIIRKMRESLLVRYSPHEELSVPIYFEEVFLRSITLPPTVAQAIRNKLAQKHLMLEYDYRLQREEKEAERKRIEAEGIRMFQDIVAEGISERYLKWKGIDATLELARSPNSKIVVIGAGDDGLPIILGPLDAAAPAPQATGAAGQAPAGTTAPPQAAGAQPPPQNPPPTPP